MDRDRIAHTRLPIATFAGKASKIRMRDGIASLELHDMLPRKKTDVVAVMGHEPVEIVVCSELVGQDVSETNGPIDSPVDTVISSEIVAGIIGSRIEANEENNHG